MTTIMATQWQRNLICNTNIYRFVKPEMQTAHCKIVFVLFSYALRWCEGWKGDGSSPTKTGFSIIVISSQKVISCLPHCKATTEAAIVQSCTALYERTEAGCLIYTSNIRPTTISSASTVLSIAMYTKTIYCSNTIIILHTLVPPITLLDGCREVYFNLVRHASVNWCLFLYKIHNKKTLACVSGELLDR